jgi:hypothetical protein
VDGLVSVVVPPDELEKRRVLKAQAKARELVEAAPPGAPWLWQAMFALALLTAAAWWICSQGGNQCSSE